MSEITSKKYPQATDEVASLLKLNSLESSAHEHQTSSQTAGDLPVANLPVVEAASKPVIKPPLLNNNHKAQEEIDSQKHNIGSVEEELVRAGIKSAPSSSKISSIIKMVLPYILVFGIGLLAYFFYFSKYDFSQIFKRKPQSISQTVSEKNSVLSSLEKQDMANYQKWISQFYFDVSDPKVIDPDVDNSGNGLSNFQKYLLNLNPKSYDTLGLGMADSQALANGINPLSGSPLTDAQKQIVDKYFDMEVITNRLTLNQMQKAQTAGSAAVNGNNAVFYGNNNQPTPINNQQMLSAGSNQQVQTNFFAPKTGADLNADGDIDTSVVGQLDIPSLKISVPILWTKDTKNFLTDLQSGVIHYPGTAMPGQIGTTYISGHSSNYVWAKGKYNQIFSKLGDLADNGSFQITVKLKNGQFITYHYVVTAKKQYQPDDQEQFKNTGKSLVALSTCWPVGSTAKRLVVFGQLTQVEK